MSTLPPCPVDLGTLLLTMCENGRLEHLSLARLTGTRAGRWQASFRRPDTVGYKVHIADTAIEALEHVLGPDYGHTWAEVLYPTTDSALVEDDDDLGSLI